MSYLARRLVVALALPLSLFVAACGTTPVATPGGGRVIPVVAVENFWGSIASQVGGSLVKVTSLIADPKTDPHNYAPTAEDGRTVADARYVILNGAGYDPWAEKLLAANPVSGRKILNVGDLNGKKAGDNPHLWYDPDAITAVSNRIRDDLKALDPNDAAVFDQSAQAFQTSGLQPYHTLIAAIKARYSGVPVGATESIFAYLAPALGVRLITPAAFLKAVAEGTDIAAADEATVEQQIKTKQIAILIANRQNTPNNIQHLIDLAHASNIPVVTITETLTPATASYQDWQSAQLQGINNALEQATGKIAVRQVVFPDGQRLLALSL